MDDRISLYDIVLAPMFLAGACYFIYDSIRDMRRGENRPKVTDDLIVMAFERDIMQRSNAELAEMDWEDDDDD